VSLTRAKRAERARERTRSRRGSRLPAAGELLAVEAVDRSGLVVTSEGALVRILAVTPPNPLIMSTADRARVAAAYCHLVSRLRPEQSLQFYLHARPINLDEILAASRREVTTWAGAVPSAARPARDDLALSRWRLYAAMEESLRLHADHQAAMQLSAYVVIPYVPGRYSARALMQLVRPGGSGMPTAPLDRGIKEHRRAVREGLAHVDTIRAELDALSLPTRLLGGEEVLELLWTRFNPTLADAGTRPSAMREALCSLEEPVTPEVARERARRLRELVGGSALDFSASRRHVRVDRDVEQTIYAATTADATYMGWLMGATMTRQPFSLSVHVHALDRRNERTRLKMGYRRIFSVNRGAESRGRVPDFDRYVQEQEVEHLLSEMAGHDRANLFRVGVYQSIRARGPEPDESLLSEAVDYCSDQIQTAADCRVNRGEFQQRELWTSTLPLGRDLAQRTRKYATRNVGDTVPLAGTSCGSPSGVPFAFSDPGRTLELLDPYDRAHANQTMLINGRSGSGKTMAANIILSRCIAHGARGFVLDRAGHYGVLCDLVAGARQVEIGTDDSQWAINPWDVDDPADVNLEKIAFLVSLHEVMMGDEGLSTLERAQLAAAIRNVYRRVAGSGETPRESLLRQELRGWAELKRSEGEHDLAAILRNLAERLGEFCGEGSYAYLLDRKTTVPTDSTLVIFDTRRCPDVVLKPVMFSIVEYVTRRIAANRDEGRELSARDDAPMFAGKSVLLIDEGWHLVGNAATGEYANDLARRARHLGLFLIVMSQHLSDFASEHGLALIRNSTMQLFLSQHPDEIPYVQEALGLSDEEAALVGRLKTVKGSHSQMFWVNGTRGKGQVALRVGPTEYWCYTSDPLRDAPVRDETVARHDGNVWTAIAELARDGAPQGA
jgi:type IV secretory system conjugative DNA transfer VirD4/TraG family protein